MKLLFVILCLFISGIVFSQNELGNADACYTKKDYDCALTHYLAAHQKAVYTAGTKYIVEFRIAYCYDISKKYADAKAWYLKSIASKSDYGFSWWNLGSRLSGEKKYDSAIICFHKAYQHLTSQEDKDNVLYRTGLAYKNKYEYGPAINEFKKIVSRSDKHRLTEHAIADWFLLQNKYDSALVYAQKATKHIPASDSMYVDLQYIFAKTYRGKKEYGKALEALDLCSAASPSYQGMVEWERGLIYTDQKDYVKANEYYTKALPYYKKDTVNTRTLYSNIVANSRKNEDYSKLIAAINNYLPYSVDKGVFYKEIASVQFGKMKQPKEAMKTAELFLSKLGTELDSTKSGVKMIKTFMLVLQGIISLNAKDSVKAIKYFSDALRYDFSNMTANLRMGDIAWNRKKDDDVKKYYTNISITETDSLFNAKPDMARAYARKAHVRHFQYNYKPLDIKSDVDNALKYDSLQKEVIYLWPLVLKSHYSLPTYRDKSLALIETGIKKYATDKKYVSDLYNAKAVLLDSKGNDTTGTRKALDEAIKIFPDNLSAWDNLMKHYKAVNNGVAGIITCDKLLTRLKKKNDSKSIAVALVNKGDFLWRQDKKAEARTVYAEAMVWDADNAIIKERAKL